MTRSIGVDAPSATPSADGDRRRHEVGCEDRRERDEEHAVGELVHEVGRDLEREAGLAGPAGAGEREQARGRRGASSPPRPATRGRRSSSAGAAGCWAWRRASADGGKSLRRPSMTSWQSRSGRERSLRRCSPRSGPTCRPGGDPRRARGSPTRRAPGRRARPRRSGRPDGPRGRRSRRRLTRHLARVHAHPDRNADVGRPAARSERTLRLGRREEPAARAREDGEERVALRARPPCHRRLRSRRGPVAGARRARPRTRLPAAGAGASTPRCR